MSPQRSWSERNRSRTRGGYVLVLLFVVVLGVIASFTIGKNHQALSPYPFKPNRAPYVTSLDPIHAAEQGLIPGTASNGGTQSLSASIRAIEVLPHQIRLVSAGRIWRHIRGFDGTHATLASITKAVNANDWIEKSGPAAFTLNSALIVDPESRLVISFPAEHELTLTTRPGVFLGVQAGYLQLDRVTVQSSSPPPANSEGKVYEPFILAMHRAHMKIISSGVSGLGWDWNGSYGVSWMGQSQGEASGSTFEHGFIGAYTNHVTGVAFRGNGFVHNQFYGIDPHSYSSGLVLTHNLAAYNGRHGIIFSKYVTGGTITHNVSRNNGENGIMMDKASTGNLIANNQTTGNQGEGIVFSESNGNTAIENLIQSNRIGIVAIHGSKEEAVANNEVKSNQLASQGISLNSTNQQEGNGGQWKNSTLLGIWFWALDLFVLLVLLTYIRIHKKRKRHVQLA